MLESNIIKNQYGPVWVHEIAGDRYLSFVLDNKIYQSIMKLSKPNIIQLDYLKMLLGGLYLNKAPQNILLIDLGGGTLAKALNTILYYPTAS